MEEITPASSLDPSPIRFAIFEVDLRAGELRRQGFKVKLQEQPFQVLAMLLERSGEVVTREELQQKLWPADTFVDFERGLNRAINKLREALRDDADNPRFIETLPRRGYRFLAPVERERNQFPILLPDRHHKAQVLTDDTVGTTGVPRRQVLPWAVAAILAAIAMTAFWRPWRAATNVADRPFLQLDLDAGPDEFSQPAISPDGARIAFVSRNALVIRRLDQATITELAGTEGAFLPFFSPSGQWIGFFAQRKLKKVAVEGGAPITLCDAPMAEGGAWGDDDHIVAALDGKGLSLVPAAGGTPQPLTDSNADPAGPLKHIWPQALPGGKGVLFAAVNGSLQGSLRILSSHDGKLKTVVQNATDGRYLASGYLVYYQRGTLFAAPMDAGRLELAGPAAPLVPEVADTAWARADFDVSNTGTLVYRRGTARTNYVLSWLQTSGNIEPVLTKPGNYVTPRLSPDGTRLALSVIQGREQNLWVYDFSRETLTPLTFGATPAFRPIWTPDGEFLAYRSGNTLAWERADGSGKLERLAGVGPNVGPGSFSADGKWLAFWPLQNGSDLWTAPVERTPGAMRLGQPHLLLQEAGSKGAPEISPDGRWLAYTSNASGRFEIYVVPFSPERMTSGGKWPISSGGGVDPIWSRNSRELFYQSLDHRVQVAAYTVTGDTFVPERPRAWSDKQLGDTGIFPAFDVAPDGKRVLALFNAEDPRAGTHLRVMLNVESELRRRTGK